MNKIYKYVMMGIVAISMSSCGNDWLDLDPSTFVPTKVTSKAEVDATLNGIYSTMQDPYAYSGRLVYYVDMSGDDM